MPANSYKISNSPSLPKKKNSKEEKIKDAQASSSTSNGTASNGKIENILEEAENNIDVKKDKKTEKNGILKKKVEIGTITLNGVDKSSDAKKWQENYVPTDTENTDDKTRKKSSNSTTTRRGSKDEKDDSMSRKISEIFKEVFKEDRGNWSLKIEYYLSCIGVPIAFSSLWRFPQLIANYGGGAFLFSYIVLMVLIGVPLYFLESALGQFSQLSVVHIWRCAPIMQGVGIAMVLLSLIASVYNSQIVAYAVHYFFASFVNMDTNVLWGECKYYWEKCYDVRSNRICSFLNLTNINVDETDPKDCVNYLTSSTRFYWEDQVLRLTDLEDVGKTGPIHWDLILCLAFVWVSASVFLIKGIKSTGKVALITGFIPICILISFLVMSVQKAGARMGLEEFYYPDWEKLAKAEVWQKAAEQVLFSLCVTYGSVLTFSSYKKFKSEIQIGAILLTFGNIFVSVMAATTIFAMYGALANSIGVKDVKSLMENEVSGIETMFVFVPEATARLFPYAHVWAIFFFLMLMVFGLHAQFSLLETCLTAVYDALPKLRTRKYLAVVSLILPLFLLSIPLSSSTGLHIHSIIGSSVVGPNVLLIAILEILSLMCVYGVRRFSKDMSFILKREPSMFWKVCCVFVAPVTLLVLLIFAFIDYDRLLYDGRRDDKDWALYLSWVLTLLPLSMIPVTFIFTIFYKLCVKEAVFQPSPLWGPGCAKTRDVIQEQRRLLKEAKKRLDGNENEAFDQNK